MRVSQENEVGEQSTYACVLEQANLLAPSTLSRTSGMRMESFCRFRSEIQPFPRASSPISFFACFILVGSGIAKKLQQNEMIYTPLHSSVW
jgi:hypothetical protein